MNAVETDTPIAISKVQDCLLVSIQGMLVDALLGEHRTAIFERIQSMKVNGVIFDFNAVSTLDTFAFKIFVDITKMILLMGMPTVWVALNPGVVSALIDLDVNTKNLYTARTLENGLQLIEKFHCGRKR